MPASLQKLFRWLGGAGMSFLAFLILLFALSYLAPQSGFRILAELGAFITGMWFAIRILRTSVWRLRNRLIVTYVFIAVVPIVLVAALAAIGGYLLINQLAIYLVTSELDRRIDSLDTAAESIVRTPPAERSMVMQRMAELFYRDHTPGLEILIRENGKLLR